MLRHLRRIRTLNRRRMRYASRTELGNAVGCLSVGALVGFGMRGLGAVYEDVTGRTGALHGLWADAVFSIVFLALGFLALMYLPAFLWLIGRKIDQADAEAHDGVS